MRRYDKRRAGEPLHIDAKKLGRGQVLFVCPVLTPQDAGEAAIGSGMLTQREATPLAVKLGAAAAQEEKGNLEAAIEPLKAATQQVEALVASQRATSSEMQPLIDETRASRSPRCGFRSKRNAGEAGRSPDPGARSYERRSTDRKSEGSSPLGRGR